MELRSFIKNLNSGKKLFMMMIRILYGKLLRDIVKIRLL